MTRRVATIDIGTNSVLLLAAEQREDGNVVALAERMEITRLGRGVDRTRRLAPEALDETLAAVKAFAEEARSLGCTGVFATATSAARDAENGRELIDGAAALGVPVEIIAGEHEARLSWRAVADDFSRHAEPLAVIDIGGGSTEFILGAGDTISYRHSFDVGSVRLTERFLEGDPPTAGSLERLRAGIRAELRGVPTTPPGTKIVGIAGTFTTVASIAMAMEPYDAARIHGSHLTVAEMERVATQLASLPLEARRRVPGLTPKRADVIVAGAILAVESVRALGADHATIGDRGVRWGYLAEVLARQGA